MLTAMNDTSDASPTAVSSELDEAMADLFDLDVRVGHAAEDPRQGCSVDCTDDGCTSATKC
jgi:hypothetical protein